MTKSPRSNMFLMGLNKTICVFILCKDNNSQPVYLCLQILNFKMSKMDMAIRICTYT
jgi:hypothetical protein